jgi:8-oxo-dGTP pyrophosphatase MutT (NUDIX family)
MALIDARLGADAPEEITPGDAVAGMSLNGVGLATRPWSFTPQCLANTPLDRWCREGVRAEMGNRFQLGRTLDQVHTYGGELVLSDMGVAVCAHAGLDWRFHHLDTTSVALTGESVPERDAQAMTITPGSSKDHRPAVQQDDLAANARVYVKKCVVPLRESAMGAAEEIIVIVDEHNQIVGAAPRREMRAMRLPHRSTYVLVFNSYSELYVQKRTLTKDVFPGYFDVAAGGVVLAGETYEQGAARELEEEMGIRSILLNRLFEFYFEDEHTRLWGCAFACVYDGAVVLQEAEVESGAFVPVSDILRRAETEPFTPDGMYVLQRYLNGRE